MFLSAATQTQISIRCHWSFKENCSANLNPKITVRLKSLYYISSEVNAVVANSVNNEDQRAL